MTSSYKDARATANRIVSECSMAGEQDWPSPYAGDIARLALAFLDLYADARYLSRLLEGLDDPDRDWIPTERSRRIREALS